MFNFKKIKEVVTKMTSVILTASLSLGMFSATSVKAMGSSNENRRFIILGNEKSGKTNIIYRMMNNKFEESYNATIGVDFFNKTYNFNSNQYDVEIWDATGQEMCRNIVKPFIQTSAAIILTLSYDDEEYSKSIEKWLNFAEKALKERNSRKKIPVKPVKVVLTKSDIDKEDKKFAKGDVEEYLKNINGGTYQKLKIENTVIETSAKNNNGINHKGNEEINPETCLENYLLNLFDQQKQSSDTEDIKQGHSSTKQPETNSFGKNNNKGQSIFQKAKDIFDKHPVISIGALATVFVLTPLLIFKNKIINGVKNIFGKKQIKKPTAKRIKITN